MSTSDFPKKASEALPGGAQLPQPEVLRSPDEVVRDSFSEYLKQFWKQPVVCPVCRTTEWTILSPIDPPVRYSPGFATTLIPVTCNTCKYVMLFNAVAAGLFDAQGNPVPYPKVEEPPPPPPPSTTPG
jgi:hypothetical protein